MKPVSSQARHRTPVFGRFLGRWKLTPQGEPLTTPTSHLLPVLHGDTPAMLKIALAEEEQRGAALMAWWNGEGAARVLRYEDNALVMERATGTASLAEMARAGSDDEATRILCAVTRKLHEPKKRTTPDLIPLPRWFRALEPAASRHGGVLAQAAATARELLATPRETVVLHGDIHHQNVLDFGPRGWLAIDPKGLLGERYFDYANTLRNPDAETATKHGRLARQATIIADAAGLERRRLLKWLLAFAGLSAAWIIADGNEPQLDLAIAEIAAAELMNAGPS